MDAIELFVFPLPDVILYPRLSLPLNIFEPRYLQMMEDALGSGTRIAMSRVDPTRAHRVSVPRTKSAAAKAFEGKVFFPSRSDLAADAADALAKPTRQAASRPAAPPRKRTVVGFGRPEVVQRRPDGTMLIVLHGEGKARLGEVVSDRPYITCRAQEVQENTRLREGNRFVLHRLKKHYLSWLDRHVTDSETRTQLMSLPDDPVKSLDVVSLVMLRDAETQQAVLEMDDVNERLEFLRQLFLDKN